jgi:signal transduction histidine kinase
LNRSLTSRLSLVRPARSWPGAVVALLVASLAGLAFAQILMNPPAGDLRGLALYFLLSGGVSITLGWLALRATDRAAGLSIQSKAFLGAVIGSAVALLNVVIIAWLMFLNTAHDLPLLIVLLLFSGIVTVYFSLRVASAIAGQIGVVADSITALADGRYATRVDVGGGDEVARLARRVNELAQRLEMTEEQRSALDRERRELTAAISHDLRTPLASVRAMVEALDDEVIEEPAEVKRYYATIRREVERLNRMIDDLFELAQIDAGALRLNTRPVALQEIAAEVFDAMQAPARRDGIDLSLQVRGTPAEIRVDGARIERAIANLVRNALEHTRDGGGVEIAIESTDGWLTLRVADSGDGIDPTDLPRIWDRFYRAERSRQRGPRSDDGAGLGLAIVRGIVEAHGGAVGVESAIGKGTTFTMRLPSS